MVRAIRPTVVATIATIGFTAPCGAQWVAALDAGAARVEYDGFLPSAAVSLSPTISVRSTTVAISAFGSLLRYESGNRSVQGELATTLRAPPLGHWRPELTAGAGLSTYRDFPVFHHARLQATMTYQRTGWAGWVEALGGFTEFQGAARAAWSGGTGFRRRLGMLAVGIDVAVSALGDTSYADAISVARWMSGRWEAAAFLGVRGLSRGGGRGAYAEGTLLYALWQGLTLYAGGGRYPSDPLRGSIPGRYFSAGLRLSAGGVPRHRPPTVQLATMGARPETVGRLAGATLSVVAVRDTIRLIRVVAADAQRVEIMGDFTQWEPALLARVGPTTWQIALALPAGLHRLNLRLDGGPWLVPFGVTELDDGFGGLVGQIVVR